MSKAHDMHGKLEGNAAGDLKRRFEDLGNRMRKKCIKRRENTSKETQLTDNGSDDSKTSALTVTRTLVEVMYCGTREEQAKGARYIRKLLSSKQPPVQEVVQSGLVPILAALLRSGSEQTQYDVAWALTNILSGTSVHVRYVIEAGAVDGLVDLMGSSNERVQVQSAWALANVAFDLSGFRAFALERGAMPALLEAIKGTESVRLLREATWAVSGFCADNADFGRIRAAIPVLGRLLHHQDDTDVLYNCATALAHLSHGPDRIQDVIGAGIVPQAIDLLKTDNQCILKQILKVLANLSSGTEKELDSLVKHDVLNALKKCFDSQAEYVRYKATFILANISSCSGYIGYVVNNTFVTTKVLCSLGRETERVTKQAVFTLRNILIAGDEDLTRQLADKSVLTKLCGSLNEASPSIVHAALTSLEELLEYGEGRARKEGAYNRVALDIEECGGLDSIEQLQSHGNRDIYRKAFEIMETFFTEEEEKTTEMPTMPPKLFNVQAATD